jgi:iron(II)-dependent oxidoreductase
VTRHSLLMAVRAAQTDPLPPNVEPLLDAFDAARRRTLELIAPLSDSELEAVHSPIMSPLVWDLAHIAAYEDLWIGHRLGGHKLLHGELAAAYDAFETPRAVRGEIELLGPAAARDYLQEVREGAFAAITENGIGDGVICEMVLRHELQHTETMRQTMAIAGLLAPGEGPQAIDNTGGWMTVAGGPFSMGAPDSGFAYDNERPRHELMVETFEIARHPVTNATWMHFSEGGGYERREWWSHEGWAWKEEYDISHHPAVATGHPQAPVCHVSWFEADAFARSLQARLPSEAEWEKAATWDQMALEALGSVWEWTSSHFEPYPGFEAYPYREYSEVFFGQDYRVLRGGSWATHPRVASSTFRNWDLPLRRQIFAGLRLARKAGD